MATKPLAKASAKTAPGKPSNTAQKPAPKTPANSAIKKPAASATKSIDLGKLFGSVAKTLVQNQAQLNTADTYNHDHGDNMVQIFEVITQAMKEKQNASPADQLAYASQLLRTKSQSGSAQLYAEGLSDAASQFKGAKSIDTNTAMTLIQTLLGAQGSVSTSGSGTGDLLGSLLGGLTSAQQTTTQTQASGSGDLLGGLLGGLMGSSETASAQSQTTGSGQIDIGDLLNAGMAFAQTKQSGGSNMDAILNAVVSSSKMGDSAHRSQSGALVANTLMQVVSQMAAGK
jgi:phosphoenolpyruvate---glycerone phosphotransferase subunit DhaL